MIKNVNYYYKRIEKICDNSKDMTYKMVKIPKKNGKYRVIHIPNEKLKQTQKIVLKNILEKIEISQNAMAFVKGKSIKDNAKNHVNKKYILNIDLKDFFYNIKHKQVYLALKKEGYNDHNASKLAYICTYKGHLPQGAPTSPYLSNIICKDLDKEIFDICSKIDASYSRYADDITISSNNYNIKDNFKNIEDIINRYGFKINKSKTRYLQNTKKQVVTGVIVNEKLNIDNKLKKEIRQILYFCEKYGLKNHLEYKNYSINEVEYRNKLQGKISFINNINPDLGKIYIEKYGNINY